MQKRYYLLFLFILLLMAALNYRRILDRLPQISELIPILKNTTPGIPENSKEPRIAQKTVYKIAMIGDSMTAALGPHGGELSEYLNSIYREKPTDPQRIIIDNYATSSSILAVDEEIAKKVKRDEYTFGALVSEDYDIILLESYGYNPLSQFGLSDGIKEQNKTLDRIRETLSATQPHSVIIFFSTISPNIENYAKTTQTHNTDAQRKSQAQERIVYLKNHIEYARNHHIPLIDIYDDSLSIGGDGNTLYISPDDGIHPSVTGLTFISHEIGDFIYNNKILLK